MNATTRRRGRLVLTALFSFGWLAAQVTRHCRDLYPVVQEVLAIAAIFAVVSLVPRPPRIRITVSLAGLRAATRPRPWESCDG